MYARVLRLTHKGLDQALYRARIHTSSTRLEASRFLMPALSPTMTEGGIATWLKNEGESYAAGDVLLQIETDKAQMDVEAQDDGVLAKILKPGGTQGVAVGEPIAIIAEEGDDLSSIDLSGLAATPEKPAKDEPTQATVTSPEPAIAAASPASVDTGKPGTGLYSPAAGYAIHANRIANPEDILATGPKGRVLKGDVLKFLKSGKAKLGQPAAAALPESKPAATQAPSNISASITAGPSKPAPKPAGPAVADKLSYLTRVLESSVLRHMAQQELKKKGITVTIQADGILALKKKLGSQFNLLALVTKAAAIAANMVPLVEGGSASIGVASAGSKDAPVVAPVASAEQTSLEELSKIFREAKPQSADAGSVALIISPGGLYTPSTLTSTPTLIVSEVYSALPAPAAEAVLDHALDDLIGDSSSDISKPHAAPKPSAVLDIDLISSSQSAAKFLAKLKSLLAKPELMSI